MAYLHDIVENLMDEISYEMESMSPRAKASVGFRRRTEESRMSGDSLLSVAAPRVFEFGRESITPSVEMAGDGYVTYQLGIPVRVLYPSGSRWHAAAYGDVSQIYKELRDTAVTTTGAELREVLLDSARVVQSAASDNWFVMGFQVLAIVAAEI